MYAKGTLAVHSSMGAFFNSSGHGLLVFFTRGSLEYGNYSKLCRIYCVPKKFSAEAGEILYSYHKRHTNRGKNRRLLAQIARMHLLVNHWHIELWNIFF
jgi:hypothetical protein